MEIGDSGQGVQQKDGGGEEGVGQQGAGHEASSGRKSGIVGALKRGIELLRSKLRGKLILSGVDGGVRIVEGRQTQEEEERIVGIEELMEEAEEVVIEKADTEDMESTGSGGSRVTNKYSYLEVIGEEEVDEELNKRMEDNRKRKRTLVKETMMVRGLKVSPGWEERAKGAREDDRWKRKVERGNEVGGQQ